MSEPTLLLNQENDFYEFTESDNNDIEYLTDHSSNELSNSESFTDPSKKKRFNFFLSRDSRSFTSKEFFQSGESFTPSILHIHLLSAEVPHHEKVEKSQPIESIPNLFVTCKVINDQTQTKSQTKYSTVISKCLNPIFNEDFFFFINEKKVQYSLLWDIWCSGLKPHILYSGNISLSGLVFGTCKSIVQDLKPGKIRIDLTLNPQLKPLWNVKGISKNKLICWLTPANPQARNYLEIEEFCHYYQTYFSTEELYDSLKKRFNGPPQEIIQTLNEEKFKKSLSHVQNAVVLFITIWLQTSPNDLANNSDLLSDWEELLKNNSQLPNTSQCLKVIKKLNEQKQTNENTQIINSYFPLNPITLDSNSNTTTPPSPRLLQNISSFSSLEIAQQITLIEWNMIKCIPFNEFLKQKWSKSEKEKKAPHLLRYISWFNRMVHYFSTEILKRDSVQERAVFIGKLIEIGTYFKDLRNFNGIMELNSCLHSAAISRLRNTWALIPQSLLDQFDQLTQLLSPDGNFSKYREVTKNCEPNFVPYLGLYLADFTFLDDANNDHLENGLLNLEKGKMTIKGIGHFSSALQINYDIPPSVKLQTELLSSQVYSDNDLFRISKIAEPTSENPSNSDKNDKNRFDSKAFAKLSKTMLSVNQEEISVEGDKLSKRDFQVLLSFSTEITAQKGDVLIEEGKIQQRFFKLKSGKITVQQKKLENDALVQIDVNTFENFEMFGEEVTLEKYGPSIYTYTVASDHAELYSFNIEQINTLFENEPGLSRRFYVQTSLFLTEHLLSLDQPKKGFLKNLNLDKISGESKKQEDDPYKVILSKFRIKDEIILRTAPAIFKKTIAVSGHLFVTQSFILFFARSFGRDTKEKIEIESILELTEHQNELVLKMKKVTMKFAVKGSNPGETIKFIKDIFSMRGTLKKKTKFIPQTSENPLNLSNFNEKYLDIQKVLSKEEWDLLLKGAKTTTFKKDEYIIVQGDIFQRIHQISRGTARIEIGSKENSVKVASLSESDIFGEISFLRKSGASAHVISDSEEVDITIIEGYFINKVFTLNPSFAGHFFKYICCLLSLRIRDRKANLGWKE